MLFNHKLFIIIIPDLKDNDNGETTANLFASHEESDNFSKVVLLRLRPHAFHHIPFRLKASNIIEEERSKGVGYGLLLCNTSSEKK